jgi:SAM-dependent methyltransferase
VADPFPAWFAALEARHRQSLTFVEIRRSLQALSSLYVERRERLSAGSVFEGAGKRAAFALFYAPLHFLLMREIVRRLGGAEPAPRAILDLGCGTGSAGAAWAIEAGGRATLEGRDRNGWALQEARWNAGQLGLRARFTKGDLRAAVATAASPARVAVLLAFTVNELEASVRDALLPWLLSASRAGSPVLVVEPLARRALPWWDEWAARVLGLGGRADEWRFSSELPPTLRLLDKAAGLDHRALTGRSLYLPSSS